VADVIARAYMKGDEAFGDETMRTTTATQHGPKAATRRLAAALALSGMVTLSACASDPNHPKQDAGTVLGGVTGALIGSQFGGGTGRLVGVGVGAVLGAMVGSQIGKSMDQSDHDHYRLAAMQASSAPIDQPIQWNNPDTGHHGTVTAVNDGRDAYGNYCRRYRSTIWIDNHPQESTGTACQQPDGTWKIVN